MGKKTLIHLMIIFIAVATFKIWQMEKPLDDLIIHTHNHISVDYEYTGKYRYKVILKYTPANEEVESELEGSLVKVSIKGLDLELLPGGRKETVPTTTKTLSSNGRIQDEFELEIVETNKHKDLIKIEAHIILEKLQDMRWVPEYQVIFMQRGPYKSIDKGPIEVPYE